MTLSHRILGRVGFFSAWTSRAVAVAGPVGWSIPANPSPVEAMPADAFVRPFRAPVPATHTSLCGLYCREGRKKSSCDESDSQETVSHSYLPHCTAASLPFKVRVINCSMSIDGCSWRHTGRPLSGRAAGAHACTGADRRQTWPRRLSRSGRTGQGREPSPAALRGRRTAAGPAPEAVRGLAPRRIA